MGFFTFIHSSLSARRLAKEVCLKYLYFISPFFLLVALRNKLLNPGLAAYKSKSEKCFDSFVGKETTRIRNQISLSTSENENNKTKKSDSVVCAFSGSRGAYAEIAIQHYFDKQSESFPCKNFREVFQAVSDGKADFGMIPIENSLAGSVYDNYDNLIRFADVSICGSIKLRIEHALICNKGTNLDSIKTVYSHPQGFAQCAEFLSQYPDWKLVECSSTSEAACNVAKKDSTDCAAIASEQAATVSKLEVLKSGIEDDPRNYTRFIVIKPNNTSTNENISFCGMQVHQ